MFLMADTTILELAPTTTNRQRVRLKYLLGEFILGSWRPDLVVMSPRNFGQSNWPKTAEQLAAELPRGATGFLCRKVSANKFAEGIGTYGNFLVYVPYKDVLHYVKIDGFFDDYLKTFTPKARQNLTRSVRNFLEKNPVDQALQITSSPDDVARFHAEAVAISSQTYQSKMLDSGLPPGEVYCKHMMTLAQEGKARGYLLRDGKQAIAFAWCQKDGNQLNYNIVGYLPEHAKSSPGTVLLYLLLKDVFDNGVCQMVDFGPGEAQYKSMFATHHEEFVDAYVLRRSIGTLLATQAHHKLMLFSSAVGRKLESWGVKKRIKAILRRIK